MVILLGKTPDMSNTTENDAGISLWLILGCFYHWDFHAPEGDLVICQVASSYHLEFFAGMSETTAHCSPALLRPDWVEPRFFDLWDFHAPEGNPVICQVASNHHLDSCAAVPYRNSQRKFRMISPMFVSTVFL